MVLRSANKYIEITEKDRNQLVAEIAKLKDRLFVGNCRQVIGPV